jgi:DnaA-homolog protein
VTKSKVFPRQTTLDLGHAPEVRLSTFIPTGNENLISSLQALGKTWESATSSAPRFDQRLIHAWGPSGSGRTHILQAMVAKANDLNISASSLNQMNGALQA